jgi:hypothetical protein
LKILWTKYSWFCRACGERIYSATVPGDQEAGKYAPVGACGYCNSTQGFRQTERAA